MTNINSNIIIRTIGILIIIEGLFMFTALPFSFYYGEDDWKPILISGCISVFMGLVSLFFTKKNDNGGLGKREGYIIVASSWVVFSVIGALPWYFHGCIDNYTDAFFETMSGFTTTGASILTDIESIPKGLLFWRALTHWIGGMGIIVLSLAILPFLGIGGMQLFAAEVPGPQHDKLHPRIRETAKRLWIIYIILTVSQTILMMAGGMNFFDSVCHTFATVATGGFSTRNDSIASFSPYIQYVIIFFMILAGTNFALHYFVLKRKFSKLYKNEEWLYYIGLIFFATLIISTGLFALSGDAEESFRRSMFQVVSIITTTGFITDNYLEWHFALWFIIFILFFTGGCAGSTGGGIKIVRQVLLLKNSRNEFKHILHPHIILPVRINGQAVPKDIIFNVLAFFLFYLLLTVLGSLIMSFMGLNFESSIGSVSSCLGNIGPAFGDLGPVSNYASVPAAGKWVLSFYMLLGRLELFTVLILLTPVFWKKQ